MSIDEGLGKSDNIGPNRIFQSSEGLDWTFTDKPMTAWGGLRLVQEMLSRIRLRDVLNGCGLPQPGSNRGFDPAEMMEAFMVCVWVGGVRFSHTALLRFDETLKEIFGWESVASVSTFTRFFRRFKREDVDLVFGGLNRWFWEQISSPTLTIDLDSSVVTRFGHQEGVGLGYNPRKRGHSSHQPLFAFVADLRMVLHAWLRPGDTGTCNGSTAFMQEALAQLGGRHRVGLVRADAGFYDGKFLDWLESENLSYIISAKMSTSLKRTIVGQKSWLELGEGVAVAEFEYQVQTWSHARRFVVVRQELRSRPEALGKVLIDVPGYLFQAHVTTLSLAPAEIWRLYRGRNDSENRIAELKYDFGIKGFCLDPFYATEAAFRAVLLAYNLMSVFRQALLQAPKAVRLPTMRFQCFALGAWVGRQSRSKVLRISVPSKRRPWFEGLFARITRLQTPWAIPLYQT